MTDAGFFRGTSADQDNRFTNKKKKLLKSLKFNPILEKKVSMSKVNLDTLKPWITTKVTEMLGMEDDVLIEFIFNQLEEEHPDPKDMQINLTGFLNAKNALAFMSELWELLTSAQENIAGIPTAFLEQKKEEIKKRQQEQERIQAELRQVKEGAGLMGDGDGDRQDERRDKEDEKDEDINGAGDRKSDEDKLAHRSAKWDWEPRPEDGKQEESTQDEGAEGSAPGPAQPMTATVGEPPEIKEESRSSSRSRSRSKSKSKSRSRSRSRSGSESASRSRSRSSSPLPPNPKDKGTPSPPPVGIVKPAEKPSTEDNPEFISGQCQEKEEEHTVTPSDICSSASTSTSNLALPSPWKQSKRQRRERTPSPSPHPISSLEESMKDLALKEHKTKMEHMQREHALRMDILELEKQVQLKRLDLLNN